MCGDLVPQFEIAGLEYEFDIAENSIVAMLDTNRFSRIIQNLTDNAVLYNPLETTVSVNMWEQNNLSIIRFVDDGWGIPVHLVKDIFKLFVRADDSRNSKTGGSELGLSIAKNCPIA